MSAPAYLEEPLGGDRSPIVRLYRPSALQRFRRRADLVVLSADGRELSRGEATCSASFRNQAFTFPADQRPPPAAWTPIDLALARLVERWREIFARELRIRNFVAGREAARRAAESRLRAVQEEIRALDEAIAKAREDLPDDVPSEGSK